MAERNFSAVPINPRDRRIHTLSDGRTLGYLRYGADDGSPVYYFHGCPSCRFEGAPTHAPAKANGFTVYALERPGCGESSHRAGYRVLDWAADVADFADAMGHERFGIVGFSGGGVYVSACTAAIPERLRFAYDLGGWGPVGDVPALSAHLAPLDRFFLQRADAFPWLFRMSFALVGLSARFLSDQGFARSIMSSMGDDDRTFITTTPTLAAFLRGIVKESFAQGSAGPTDDALRCYSPWGFSVEDIPFPTQIWHGTDDRFAPIHLAEYKHRAIKNSVLRTFPGKGHFHMPLVFGELFAEAAQSPMNGAELEGTQRRGSETS